MSTTKNPRGRRRRPRRRRNNKPLRVSFADRLAPLMPQLAPSEPSPRTRPLPAPPPKPARDILSLLLAATGFALAARRNASVELLPGLPVTVVISAGRNPAAAFVLPISQAEACKAFGKPVPVPRDPIAELLYEEERQADAPSLHDVLDLEDRYAC
jgi:hypothetical protein